MLLSERKSCILYAIILFTYIYGLYCFRKVLSGQVSSSEQMMGLLKFEVYFFTSWNFALQHLFLFIALCEGLAKELKFGERIVRFVNLIRSQLFNCIVFPCTFMVMGPFWTMYFYDRSLIFPKELDAFYPSWANHLMHTMILLPPLIELCIPKQHNFVKFKYAWIYLSVFAGIYQILYTFVFMKWGIWLYPVWYRLNYFQMVIFLLVQYSLAIFYCYLGIFIQNLKRPKVVKSE